MVFSSFRIIKHNFICLNSAILARKFYIIKLRECFKNVSKTKLEEC